MNRMQEEVAIVTGGGAGIGRATCELFADEGASVVVAERDAVTGQETVERISGRGGRAHFVQTDVANETNVQRMVAEAVAVFSRIDVLVNNAAVFVLRGIEATPEEWRQVLDVNVMGPALVAKPVVPQLRKLVPAPIVNLASISTFIPQPHPLTYN